MGQIKRTDFSTVYSCGLNLRYPSHRRLFQIVPATYRMNTLIKSGVAVDGTLCRRVRVREHSEEVGAERALGGGGSHVSNNGLGLELEPLDSTPSLHQFSEISHTPGFSCTCSEQADCKWLKALLA